MESQVVTTEVSVSLSTEAVSSTLQNNLQTWLIAARHYPAGSRERNRYLTQIIREISPRLWRTNTPYYADALQQTWLYFIRNVCTKYDPDRGCMVRWLNSTLWYRHQDLYGQAMNQYHREIAINSGTTNSENSRFRGISDIPAREYGSLSLLEQVTQWVESDPNSVLRRTHLRNRPDVNCQALILLRLPPETPWNAIVAQFNVRTPTLSSFYRRKCLPLLRDFCDSAGIL